MEAKHNEAKGSVCSVFVIEYNHYSKSIVANIIVRFNASAVMIIFTSFCGVQLFTDMRLFA